MIPKIIHHCWFGRGPMPDLVVRSIESWRVALPNYTFRLWNEDNFDVNQITFTRQAYARRKFAYVSDYARLYALFQEGGIYLDTDVQVLRSFDPLLEAPAFMGFEEPKFLSTAVIGSEPGAPWLAVAMDYYKRKPFVRWYGKLNMKPNPQILTKLLSDHFALQANGANQTLPGVMAIYEQVVFSPYSYDPLRSLPVGDHSYTIHHFGNLGR